MQTVTITLEINYWKVKSIEKRVFGDWNVNDTTLLMIQTELVLLNI